MNVELIGILITAIISVIALLQSQKSNQTAENANSLAKQANDNTLKDYMPVIGILNIEGKKLDIDELCGNVFFDFDNIVDSDYYYENQYDEIPLIKLRIENIGNGMITGLSIQSILICKASKAFYEKCMDPNETLSLLVYKEMCNCQQTFVLCEGKNIELYFLFDDDSYYTDYNEEDDVFNIINNFLKQEVMIKLDLKLWSINESQYEQHSVWCNFVNGKAILNTFGDVTEIDKDKLKL